MPSGLALVPEAQPLVPRSGSRNRSAIDKILSACDRSCTWRDQEGDQVGNLLGCRGSSEWDSAKRLHDNLLATFVVRTRLPADAILKAQESTLLRVVTKQDQVVYREKSRKSRADGLQCKNGSGAVAPNPLNQLSNSGAPGRI